MRAHVADGNVPHPGQRAEAVEIPPRGDGGEGVGEVGGSGGRVGGGGGVGVVGEPARAPVLGAVGRRGGFGDPGWVEIEGRLGHFVGAPGVGDVPAEVAVFVEAVEVVDAAVGAGFARLPAVAVGGAAGAVGVVVEVGEGDVDFRLRPDVVDAAGGEVVAEEGGEGGDGEGGGG